MSSARSERTRAERSAPVLSGPPQRMYVCDRRREQLLALTLLVTSLLVTSRAETIGHCGDADAVVVRGGQRQRDGSLLAEDGTSFPPGCYWKTVNTTSGCPGKLHPCLWKCCGDNQAMDTQDICHDSNNTLTRTTFQPPPYGSFNSALYDLISGEPCVSASYEIDGDMAHITLTDNGSLIVDHPDNEVDELYMSGQFCMEVIVTQDGGASSPPPRLVYFGCSDEETTSVGNPRKLKFLINSIGVLISLPFLVATLVVYAVIPELRNLHGKCLISHVVCLCVAFVCLALIQLGIDLLSLAGCIATGMMAFSFFLASFFWLNVMCFDIWWTFSGYGGSFGSKNTRDNKKFVYYSLYAWGASIVFLCACAILQFKEDIPEGYVRPNFGKRSCWFDGKPATWAFFNGPVAVLIVSNLIFFALTALSLWKIKKQTAVLNEDKDSQRNNSRAMSELQFKLYMKLFVVMGVPWTMEIISSAVGGPDYIWWLTDLANVLVGIPIFIIFVWKSKVRKLFLAKLNIKTGSSADTSAYELT